MRRNFLVATGIALFATTLHAEPTPTAPTPAEPAEAEPAPTTPTGSREDRIGITAAEERLGRDVPVGRGVVFGHVEGNNGEYLPNWQNLDYRGVLFMRRSGDSKVFGHAESTARVIYGAKGLAPGVKVVHCFSSPHWLTTGYLRVNSARPPVDDLPRVLTHSWIGDPGQGADQVLARVDYQIDERDVIMCVGVNNGANSPVPALLASAFNVIAVGVESGNNSGGYTRGTFPGRCKPDIVAPANLTSYSTPTVAAIAARLVEAARASSSPDAQKSELIKALLLAGATKPAKWKPADGRPLDEHLGAGVVHFDNSLRMLEAGPIEPGDARPMGWDFGTLKPGETGIYEFELPSEVKDASFVIVWNRRVRGALIDLPTAPADSAERTAADRMWAPFPRFCDFDLRLLKRTGDAIDTVAASTSAVDNVEHVYLPSLDAGRYVIEVRRAQDGNDEAWDYALAWRTMPSDGAGEIEPATGETSPTPPGE